MSTKDLTVQTAQDQMDFLRNNVGKILAKRFEHGNETGYIRVFTDGNYGIQIIEFVPKKWFKKSNFNKISLFGVVPGVTDIGELFFEMCWWETETMIKLKCDYYIARAEHLYN